MHINNPCIYSRDGAWCKNENIKKSLLGLGARCCKIYQRMDKENCEYFEMKPKPKPPKRIRSGVVRPPIKIQIEVVSQSSK